MALADDRHQCMGRAAHVTREIAEILWLVTGPAHGLSHGTEGRCTWDMSQGFLVADRCHNADAHAERFVGSMLRPALLPTHDNGAIRCGRRLGGVLKYCRREAA